VLLDFLLRCVREKCAYVEIGRYTVRADLHQEGKDLICRCFTIRGLGVRAGRFRCFRFVRSSRLLGRSSALAART
jgi:hypothetical protein